MTQETTGLTKQEVINGLFDLYANTQLDYDERETIKEAIQLLLKEKPSAPVILNSNPFTSANIKAVDTRSGGNPYSVKFDSDTVNNSTVKYDHETLSKGEA